jgi:hypothetical protein
MRLIRAAKVCYSPCGADRWVSSRRATPFHRRLCVAARLGSLADGLPAGRPGAIQPKRDLSCNSIIDPRKTDVLPKLAVAVAVARGAGVNDSTMPLHPMPMSSRSPSFRSRSVRRCYRRHNWRR